MPGGIVGEADGDNQHRGMIFCWFFNYYENKFCYQYVIASCCFSNFSFRLRYIRFLGWKVG